MPDLTFAGLLTAAGAGIAATIVTLFIDVLRAAIPPTASWNGATLAFIFSGLLYVLAAFATSVSTLDAGLAIFLAWLTCAAAAVGVHKVIVNPIAGAVANRQQS